MFDANMRHLPAGTIFIAEVYTCTPHSELFKLGARVGDKLKCKMLDDDDDDPRAQITVNNHKVILRDSWEGTNNWLVYYKPGDTE